MPTDAENLRADSGARASANHLVILIHGISTRALWMGEIKPALEHDGFTVGPTSYGKFGVPRFLSPFPWLRSKAISRVVSDIRTARRSHKLLTGSEPQHMSLISHSFGTYVVSKILADYPEFQWHRIIFCGSVVREDFRFDQVLERFHHPLLNEIGTRDYWPALAESVGWGYGSVGSTGFNRPPVESRWHNGLSHSDLLTESFCRKYWIPFLRGDKPKPADKPTQLPFWIRAIAWLPLRWVLLVLLIFLPLSVADVIWNRIIERSRSPTQTAEVQTKPPEQPTAPTQPTDSTAPPRNDPLDIFAGIWVSVQPAGVILSFLQGGLGTREVSLPIGTAAVRVSDGRYGSNLVVSGQAFSCYYFVSKISSEDMTWEFRGGDGVCLPSMHLKKDVSQPKEQLDARLVGAWIKVEKGDRIEVRGNGDVLVSFGGIASAYSGQGSLAGCSEAGATICIALERLKCSYRYQFYDNENLNFQFSSGGPSVGCNGITGDYRRLMASSSTEPAALLGSWVKVGRGDRMDIQSNGAITLLLSGPASAFSGNGSLSRCSEHGANLCIFGSRFKCWYSAQIAAGGILNLQWTYADPVNACEAVSGDFRKLSR